MQSCIKQNKNPKATDGMKQSYPSTNALQIDLQNSYVVLNSLFFLSSQHTNILWSGVNQSHFFACELIYARINLCALTKKKNNFTQYAQVKVWKS